MSEQRTPEWLKKMVTEATEMKPVARAKFVVIEGIDGSGKSTLAERLLAALRARGRAVHGMSFPSKTRPIGQLIRSMFLHYEMDEHAMQALMLAEMFDEQKQIASRVARGEYMIADRWAYSTTAYSRTKGVSERWVAAVKAPLLDPDLLIVLNIPIEVAVDRIEARGAARSKYEDRSVLVAAHDYYRTLSGDKVRHIDGMQTRKEIEDQALTAILA